MSQAQPRRRRNRREHRGPARSCERCFAWGLLRGRLCRGCQTFAEKYPTGRCGTCNTPHVPVCDGVCRPCRKQAGYVAGPSNKTSVDLTVAAITGHQLFLADLPRSRRVRSAASSTRSVPPRVRAAPAPRGFQRWSQQLLWDPPRDCRHASSLGPPRDPALLEVVLSRADALAERNGWPPRTLQQVCRGLRMLASCHDVGEPIKASTVTAMSHHGVPAIRVLEVLGCAGEGLVVDDRRESLDVWIDEKFADLPPRMRDELDEWIVVLRHGTPRRRPHPRITVFTRLAAARPFLLDCATRYTTLRQVTREDVAEWLDGRKQAANDLSALRDLFGVLKAQRLVFTNPTHRIRVSGQHPSTPTPLSAEVLLKLGEAAENDSTLRLVRQPQSVILPGVS